MCSNNVHYTKPRNNTYFTFKVVFKNTKKVCLNSGQHKRHNNTTNVI